MTFEHYLDGVLPIPIDCEDPAYWDEFFGDDREDSRPAPRRYSTVRRKSGSGPYRSWKDFLDRTSEADRMRWCAKKVKVANRPRLMSGRPDGHVTTEDVWRVLLRAQGRCRHCGSLAVERRPSDPKTGAPRRWEEIGRRIGSLEHVQSRFDSGVNDADNLAWCCLWCNTWVSERRRGALDHGGYYPGAAVTPARGGHASAAKRVAQRRGALRRRVLTRGTRRGKRRR
jgi:hypothetical protein